MFRCTIAAAIKHSVFLLLLRFFRFPLRFLCAFAPAVKGLI